jgi:hypothetical protein
MKGTIATRAKIKVDAKEIDSNSKIEALETVCILLILTFLIGMPTFLYGTIPYVIQNYKHMFCLLFKKNKPWPNTTTTYS